MERLGNDGRVSKRWVDGKVRNGRVKMIGRFGKKWIWVG
jgi:hypothetical protein